MINRSSTIAYCWRRRIFTDTFSPSFAAVTVANFIHFGCSGDASSIFMSYLPPCTDKNTFWPDMFAVSAVWRIHIVYVPALSAVKLKSRCAGSSAAGSVLSSLFTAKPFEFENMSFFVTSRKPLSNSKSSASTSRKPSAVFNSDAADTNSKLVHPSNIVIVSIMHKNRFMAVPPIKIFCTNPVYHLPRLLSR